MSDGHGKGGTCRYCGASCRDNGRGEPSVHFPNHTPAFDPDTGVGLWCPGGNE